MEVLTASSDRIAPFLSPQRATTYEESRRVLALPDNWPIYPYKAHMLEGVHPCKKSKAVF
jgi:hypothetical protein